MRIHLSPFRAAGLAAVAVAPALAPALALAQQRPAHPAAKPPARPAANAPRSIGKFDDWQAATHAEAGQQVCYAFVRAQASQPALPGRSDVVLTVTQRPSGRDAVAISAGFTYAQGAEVTVGVDKTELPFYTNARSAFAKDGASATKAFAGGSKAVARSPGPRNTAVSDTFSLRGFAAAYAAINKACPAR